MFLHKFSFIVSYVHVRRDIAFRLRSVANAWCRSNDMTVHDRLVLSIFQPKPQVSTCDVNAPMESRLTKCCLTVFDQTDDGYARDVCFRSVQWILHHAFAHTATVANYIRILRTNDRYRGRVHLHRLNSFYFYFLLLFLFYFSDEYLVDISGVQSCCGCCFTNNLT